MYTYKIKILSFPDGKTRYAVLRFTAENVRPMYLHSFRSGRYVWYHDLINARPFSWKTALKHVKALQKMEVAK